MNENFTEKTRVWLTQLETCEQDLKRIITESTEAGAYDVSQKAIGYAQVLRDLISRVRADLSTEATRMNPTEKKKKQVFYVEDGQLVKVGWSKKQGREYLHKIPLPDFWEVIDLMEQLAYTGQGRVRANELQDRIATMFAEKGENFPAYRLYLVLAFLLEHKIITKEHRGEYRIPESLREKAEQAISKL